MNFFKGFFKRLRRHRVTQKSYPKPPIITPEGTLIYDRVNWEPPFLPPGYHRQSDDLASIGAWILVRDTPLCKHLLLYPLKDANCSCVRIQSICTIHKTGKCNECDHREPRNVQAYSSPNDL